MWAQTWTNIYELVAPEPEKSDYHELVTQNMISQDWTITPQLGRNREKSLHGSGEAFYRSMGFEALPDSFWKKSLFEKPPDKEPTCHASAWPFLDTDVRVKMCNKF